MPKTQEEKPKCKLCGKTMQAIKNDFVERKMHKKCFFEANKKKELENYRKHMEKYN